MKQSTFFTVAGDPLSQEYQSEFLNQILNAEEQGYEVAGWATSPLATGYIVLTAHCTREMPGEEGSEPEAT